MLKRHTIGKGYAPPYNGWLEEILYKLIQVMGKYSPDFKHPGDYKPRDLSSLLFTASRIEGFGEFFIVES
jgi:hypothetical protein